MPQPTLASKVELIDDSLLVWEVALHDWAFDPSSPLSKDLEARSTAAVASPRDAPPDARRSRHP